MILSPSPGVDGRQGLNPSKPVIKREEEGEREVGTGGKRERKRGGKLARKEGREKIEKQSNKGRKK